MVISLINLQIGQVKIFQTYQQDHVLVQLSLLVYFHSHLPVDMYISRLTNSVASILCLGIHGWIPVTVVKYHSIRSSKIYTNSTRACGEDKTKYSFVLVESVHQYLQKKVSRKLFFVFVFFLKRILNTETFIHN